MDWICSIPLFFPAKACLLCNGDSLIHSVFSFKWLLFHRESDRIRFLSGFSTAHLLLFPVLCDEFLRFSFTKSSSDLERSARVVISKNELSWAEMREKKRADSSFALKV